MGDFMAIPDTWEQFLEMYSFKDAEEHYTNCASIITVNRVKQIVEFYFSDVAPVVHGRWKLIGADKRGRGGIFNCTACGRSRPLMSTYFPDCGAKMDGDERELF